MSWRSQKMRKNNIQVLGFPCYALREIIRHALECYLIDMAICSLFGVIQIPKKTDNQTKGAISTRQTRREMRRCYPKTKARHTYIGGALARRHLLYI